MQWRLVLSGAMALTRLINPRVFPIIDFTLSGQTSTKSLQLSPLSVMYESISLKIFFPVLGISKCFHIHICSSTWLLCMYLTKTEIPAMSVASSRCTAKPYLFWILLINSHSLLQLIPSSLLETVEFEREKFSIAFRCFSKRMKERTSVTHGLTRCSTIMCASSLR